MAHPALNPSYPLASPLTLNPAALGLQPGLERCTAPPAKQPLMRAPQPQTPRPARGKRRMPVPPPLREQCVHHAIGAQAQRQADVVAVEHQGQAWTYGQLHACAEYLARRLAEAWDTRSAFHALFATYVQKEGMQAFIEKRPPQFRRPR